MLIYDQVAQLRHHLDPLTRAMNPTMSCLCTLGTCLWLLLQRLLQLRLLRPFLITSTLVALQPMTHHHQCQPQQPRREQAANLPQFRPTHPCPLLRVVLRLPRLQASPVDDPPLIVAGVLHDRQEKM